MFQENDNDVVPLLFKNSKKTLDAVLRKSKFIKSTNQPTSNETKTIASETGTCFSSSIYDGLFITSNDDGGKKKSIRNRNRLLNLSEDDNDLFKRIPKKRKRSNKNKNIDNDANGANDDVDGIGNKLSKSNDSKVDEIKTIKCGRRLKIGNSIFINSTTIYRTDFNDYTLITNSDFTEYFKYAPLTLKNLLEPRWYYSMHISHGMQPSVNRNILKARVLGGEILAYKFTKCSIEGNECVYYGFIPTIAPNDQIDNVNAANCLDSDDDNDKFNTEYNENNRNSDFKDTHRNCRIAMLVTWPRKLYIYLSREFMCDCSPGCSIWACRMEDYYTEIRFCVKQIPWERLYVIMGDADNETTEEIKIARNCVVCAQCFDCSQSAEFCRKHKICKHKRSDNYSIETIKGSKIKKCNKFNQ